MASPVSRVSRRGTMAIAERISRTRTGSFRTAGSGAGTLVPSFSAGQDRTGYLTEPRRCFAAAKGKTKGDKAARAVAGQSDGGALAQPGRVFRRAGAVPRKQLALMTALKQVELTYGKGSVMQLGSKDVAKVEVIPTGSLSLDHALGVGGLPRGRVVEVYGPESSGKTTVALHAVAQCQKVGGTAVFIDAEHALDSAYAKAIGVDISKLYLAQPDNGEQALDIVDTLVRSAAVDVVVVDSVAALVPKAELEGEMGDHHIALQARLMSQALRKLTAILNNTSCTLIFINQIRQKVGVVFGNPDVTTGGMALRFYSSVRLEVRKGQQIKANGELVGTQVKMKVAKNKLAPPFGKAEVDLMYGKGFDLHGELLDLGASVGLVSKSGAWFGVTSGLGVNGTELEGNSSPWLMGQGREKSKAFLIANPKLCQKLQKTIADRLASGDNFKPESGDIPSDPLPLATAADSLRNPHEMGKTDLGDDEQTDIFYAGSARGSEEVLLEPGVASEAALHARNTSSNEDDVAEDGDSTTDQTEGLTA